MYHLKLCRGLSYCNASGTVRATRKQPDVYISDKTDADAAVASGFFTFIGEEDAPAIPPIREDENAAFDAEALAAMSDAELEALVKEKGIDLTGCQTREDALEAISVALGGSYTMLDLIRE